MKTRQYFNRSGNLPENEIKNYVDSLVEKYGKHLKTYKKIYYIKQRIKFLVQRQPLLIKLSL